MSKELFYNSIAGKWPKVMNTYEVDKRIMMIFTDLLTEDISNKSFLDAGCGIGLFSEMAEKRGANVTSLDVGEELLTEVSKRCRSRKVVGSVTNLPFEDNTFDYVIATEVLEHTEDPRKGFSELVRVVKPEGKLIVTIPNRMWKFSVYIADFLRIRPYHGNENWLFWFELRKLAAANSLKVKKHFGFNILPIFHPPFTGFINYMDRFSTILHPFMVNTAIYAIKINRATNK